MPKERALLPFPEVCRSVWGDCLARWPLFLVQLALLVLQYATLFLCVVILVLPHLKDLGGAMEWLTDPTAGDPERFLEELLSRVMGSGVLVTFLVLAFLYSTWWLLLTAFSDGGMFRCFLKQRKGGGVFALGEFMRDGAELLAPMLLLQFFFFLLFLAWSLPFLGLGLLGTWALTLLAENPIAILLGVLLAIPYLLCFLGSFVLFLAYTFMARAYVADGSGAWEALGASFDACRSAGWRAWKGLSITFLLYLVLAMIFSVFFGVLSLIPILGVLFDLADILVGTVLYLSFMVFTPALAVRYLSETGRGR
jgi:hypothetical protein